MLDVQVIRDNPERVRQAMLDKGYPETDVVDRLLELDAERRRSQAALDEKRSQANALSREIGQLMQSGRRDEAERARQETAGLKADIRELEERNREAEVEQQRLLLEIPNLPHPSVPVGSTPEENQVVFTWGRLPFFEFEALPHWELAARHDLIDFDRGAKVTGAGFPFYRGKGARLQRALINFFLDLATGEGGYTEMEPPFLVNAASATGTGQLPDKEGQMYESTRDALYLVPTAEVPVTNFLRDEILNEAELPVQLCAYTPCFRREAGSYGKDVRGLNRLHQFDKVELVRFVHPDDGYDALEALREDAERAVQRLGIPYRRLLMCTGDMGFTQTKKYDLEVWSAGQERWLEVSSISNFGDFQARRANIRFRPAGGGRPQFVHTLNGSGLALPRVLAALLENNQEEDGSITIPAPLRPYTGFERIG